MKFESVIEIGFDSEKDAHIFYRVLGEREESKKTIFSLQKVGKKLVFKIVSSTYAGLRARTTTLLRDLKAVFDVRSIVEKN